MANTAGSSPARSPEALISGFADHFSGHAAAYSAHRPGYAPEFIAFLASHVAGHRLAWDAGTGSGQAAMLLAEHFDHVLATDPSSRQLAEAMAHPRVEYQIAAEECPALGDASVDCVSVAQALHWFDTGRFFREVRRVLRPGGIVACWCYGDVQVDEAVDRVIVPFSSERVGMWWPPERRHISAMYRTIPFPFERIGVPEQWLERHWTRRELLAYIATWSAVQRARAAESGDPMDELTAALDPVWPDDAADRRLVRWPMGVLLGRA